MTSYSTDSSGLVNSSSSVVANDSVPPSCLLANSPISHSSIEISYNPDQLKFLLQSQKHKYCVLTSESSKDSAPFWRSFGYPAILNKHDQWEKISGFISCIKCYKTQTYGPNSGTKRFNEHANKCVPIVSSSIDIDGVDVATTTKQATLNQLGFKRQVNLTADQQNHMNNLYAKWICSDLRPLSILEDGGFKHIAQSFIKIGANHGLVDASTILRSRQTIARIIADLATKYRLDLQQELLEPLQAKSITIIPDFWTDKHKQQSYLGVNITFVNLKFEFKTIDLFCRPFVGIKSHHLVLEALHRHLADFGIPDLTSVNIMSDRGSNFVKAFSDYNPMFCFGHRLNNVLKVGFFQQPKKKLKVTLTEELSSDSDSNTSEIEDNENIDEKKTTHTAITVKNKNKVLAHKMVVDDVPTKAKEVLLTLKLCKKLVKYVKQSGLNRDIKAAGGTTLHQSSIVRWLSMSDLLESILKSYKITKKLLAAKQQQRRIIDINETCVKQLVFLLKPFKHVISLIQSGSGPSLYLVSMCLATLKDSLSSFQSLIAYCVNHCGTRQERHNTEDSDDDCVDDELEGIAWFRERLLTLLNQMILLDLRHISATLLHPRYRSLKTVPENVKQQSYKYVRRQIKLLRDQAEADEQFQKEIIELPKKKFKNDQPLFSRFESGNVEEKPNKREDSGEESDEYQYDIRKADELDRYLLLEYDKSKELIDPLKFWAIHENNFPFLCQYARSLHSIPATTGCIEREFSTAGWIINERRTSLKPEHVDNILLVRSVQKYKQ